MTYDTFITNVKKELELRHPNQWKVDIHMIEKNNSQMHRTLIITNGDNRISPAIYLEDFYEKMDEAQNLDSIITDIENFYESAMEMTTEMRNVDMDFEQCKSQLFCRLVSKERNKDLLTRIPYTDFLDLAIIYTYLYAQNEYGMQSIKITNDILNKWQISIDKLHEIAFANTLSMFPVHIGRMCDIIKNLCEDKTFEPEEEWTDRLFEQDVRNDMLVMTNQVATNGAMTMAYPGTLKQIADALGSNLPSSIHEVIILKEHPQIVTEELRKMVYEINRNEVSEEEFLSDNVYYYDAKMDKIEN